MEKNKKRKILIIDDEQGVIESFRMTLKDTYDVLSANTGRECLRIIKNKRPQLVILDVLLPDTDGITLFKEIRQNNHNVPVMVITGAGTHRTAIEALKLGAVDFIAKPLNFYYIRTTIADIFSKKKKHPKRLPTTEDIITKNYLSSLKTLNKVLEARDPHTRRHSKRVSEFALQIARGLGLSDDEQEVMKETALLHDIGKVGIPESILNKPDKLTEQEWEEVKRHTIIGEEILEPIKILHIEQSMIRHHHERYDGKGYPDHLRGEEIPLYARILAVADAYEAMTSERPYRDAIGSGEALAELERCSGTQFDPKIVKIFVKTLKKGAR